MSKPPEQVYLRRYVYTHHSTGKLIARGPTEVWQVVKNPSPGDFSYRRESIVDGEEASPFECYYLRIDGVYQGPPYALETDADHYADMEAYSRAPTRVEVVRSDQGVITPMSWFEYPDPDDHLARLHLVHS
jgi:hypothetical protein